MNKYEKKLNSAEETINLGKTLAKHLNKGDVIALEGDLGAGKTTFTKGIAQGLNIDQIVNSPTFTLIKEYFGRLPLYHMDVYRVSDEFEELGFEEYFYGAGVTVIEWAHLIDEQLPAERLTIYLHYINNEERIIKFVPVGKRYETICKEIFNDDDTSDR